MGERNPTMNLHYKAHALSWRMRRRQEFRFLADKHMKIAKMSGNVATGLNHRTLSARYSTVQTYLLFLVAGQRNFLLANAEHVHRRLRLIWTNLAIGFDGHIGRALAGLLQAPSHQRHRVAHARNKVQSLTAVSLVLTKKTVCRGG